MYESEKIDVTHHANQTAFMAAKSRISRTQIRASSRCDLVVPASANMLREMTGGRERKS